MRGSWVLRTREGVEARVEDATLMLPTVVVVGAVVGVFGGEWRRGMQESDGEHRARNKRKRT